MRVHSLLLLSTLSTFSVAATLPASSQIFNLTAHHPIHTQIIDSRHEIRISHYEYQAPDRPYIAALVSASNKNFVAYRSSYSHFDLPLHFDYNAYGILIILENHHQRLTYELIGGVLEALGKFLMEQRMSDADFDIREEGRSAGTGFIMKDPMGEIGMGNFTRNGIVGPGPEVETA